MSVALDESTLSASLWPASGIATRSTGQILQVTLSGKQMGRFTLMFFSPEAPATLYACTSRASVYAFSLDKNIVKLFIALECNITAMTCMGCSGNSLFICATEDNSLVWVDCETGRTVKRTKTPHQHAVHVIHPSHVVGVCRSFVTVSQESLAVWDAEKMACSINSTRDSSNERHAFLSVHTNYTLLVTVERFGRVTLWDMATLSPQKSVVMAIQPRTSAMCQKCLVVGGPGPLVAMVKPEDLSSIGCVQLSSAPVAIRSLFIIDDTLLACELTSGLVVFVVIDSCTVSFSIGPPQAGAIPRKLTGFCLSGPSFAAFSEGDKLTVIHVPTARQHYVQRMKIEGSNSSSQPSNQLYSFVQEKGSTNRETVDSKRKCKEDEKTGCDNALIRPSIRPTDRQVSKWVKVNALPVEAGGAARRKKGSTGDPNGSLVPTEENKKGGTAYYEPNAMGELSLRPCLDQESRKANVDRLHRLLLRYGLFPDEYRPVTWRFLLQLPDKRLTAPQYARLLSRGMHPSAQILMKPYNLGNERVQGQMMKILSILAWHDPMFAAIHFLPVIVYPFLHALQDDMQSVVETILIFLSNWGQEFFQFYPQQPVALTTLLDRILRMEDADLHRHLSLSGVLVDEWGWGPLRSVCSDTMKPVEWLQVMDHAFFNEPLWLFLFHIRWIISIRGEIMQLLDQKEIADCASTTHDVDMNRVIAEAYHLQARCPRGELTQPYSRLQTLVDYAYPVTWRYNEETVRTKLRDMQLLQEHVERSNASEQHIANICNQLAEADVLEEVYVKKQQVRAAARVRTEVESLKGEVAREIEKQCARDMEKMLRLQRLRQQVEQSGRLEALQEELECANVQVDHIHEMSERETVHWAQAGQLSEQDLLNLEEAARKRLQAAKTRLKITQSSQGWNEQGPQETA